MKRILAVASVFGLLAGCATGALPIANPATELSEADMGPSYTTLASEERGLASIRKERAFRLAQFSERTHYDSRDRPFEDSRYDDLLDRVEALAAAELAAGARILLIRAFLERMAAPIALANIEIVVRKERIVLQIPSDALFDVGSSRIHDDGHRMALAIAAVLSSVGAQHFDEDEEPALAVDRSTPVAVLRAERSLAVVDLLVAQGVSADQISARESGDATAPSRMSAFSTGAHASRIEVTLQPERAEPLP